MNQQHRAWDVQKISNFPGSIAAKIIATPLLPEGDPDTLIWPYSKSGLYDVKFGYHAEKSRRMKEEANKCSTFNTVDNKLWKHIWNAKVGPKIKTFIWRACKNAIPTRSNLHRRNLADNHLCPVCQEAMEDVEHLLLTCPWTRPLWFGSPLQWNPADQNVTRLDLWLHDKFNQISTKKENYEQNAVLILTLCWYI